MALPAELRVLCHQLTSQSTSQLVTNLDGLQRKLLRCGNILSSQDGNLTKAENSEGSVLVHKLKTQITTLLYGKSAEGRLVATVLIKGAVDVGGWEVLKGVESWVRGLLAILSKPDIDNAKRLCIVTLTSIYTYTHNYQSLIREITTPTLPTFVSSCLNLISIKGSGKTRDAVPLLVQAVFDAFSILVPRHPTIFRPSLSQIRFAARPYVSSTCCDNRFVPRPLRQSASKLLVLVHQTAPKNTSSEEWGKGIRDLIKNVHGTCDNVLRAVVEDWESSTGYVSETVDVNEQCHGGGKTDEDLSAWTGVDAGIERLEGLLCQLAEYFTQPTAMAVMVPLSHVEDLLDRLMSIAPPMPASYGKSSSSLRLRPGIERNEREELWTGLPRIHVAAMRVYGTMLNRIGSNFSPLGLNCLEHLIWVFPSCQGDLEFRLASYELLCQVLPSTGLGLPKSVVIGLHHIVRACIDDCSEELPIEFSNSNTDLNSTKSSNGAANNADSFLRTRSSAASMLSHSLSPKVSAARHLLPVLIGNISPEYLDAYLRASLDRIAVLTHHKDAMVASILAPSISSAGKARPTLVPHLLREFSDDNVTEILMRPRFPAVSQVTAFTLLSDDSAEAEEEEEPVFKDIQNDHQMLDADQTQDHPAAAAAVPVAPANMGLPHKAANVTGSKTIWGDLGGEKPYSNETAVPLSKRFDAQTRIEDSRQGATAPLVQATQITEPLEEVDEDSDEESVHLVMEMSDSGEE